MVAPVNLYRGGTTQVVTGGTSVVAIHSLVSGGIIWNPQSASDQGLGSAEILFVDPTGPATLFESTTTVPLIPGQFYTVTPNSTENVWVNSVSGGHQFTAILWQSSTQPSPTPVIGTFPPSGPTGLLASLPSYLYQQYTDDDDLQAFVVAYNSYTQEFVDWFNALNLPIYTQQQIFGLLLDWVAAGIYGLTRPILSSGLSNSIGPYNTQYFNQKNYYNQYQIIGVANVTATSDDVFKRMLTWHFYKGDGKYFTTRWIKRRVLRFLYGVDGTDFEGTTYQISVTWGVNQQINITILSGVRTITNAPYVFNTMSRAAYNAEHAPYNGVRTSTFVAYTVPPLATIFQEAVNTSALEMPFQFSPAIVKIYPQGTYAL